MPEMPRFQLALKWTLTKMADRYRLAICALSESSKVASVRRVITTRSPFDARILSRRRATSRQSFFSNNPLQTEPPSAPPCPASITTVENFRDSPCAVGRASGNNSRTDAIRANRRAECLLIVFLIIAYRGIRKLFPSRIMSDFKPFADLIFETVVPYFRAIPDRVSPFLTT